MDAWAQGPMLGSAAALGAFSGESASFLGSTLGPHTVDVALTLKVYRKVYLMLSHIWLMMIWEYGFNMSLMTFSCVEAVT